MRLSSITACIACLLGLATPARAAMITDVRHWTGPGHTRLVFDLTEAVDLVATRVEPRIEFTLPTTGVRGLRDRPVGDGRVRAVHCDRAVGDGTRVWVDVEPGMTGAVFTLDADGHAPPRVVVDVRPVALEPAPSAPAPPRFVVMVDPGHGGRDPGAVGPKGLREKDIVLDVARRLADRLERLDPTIDVRLTRESDAFIGLDERWRIAERADADAFVSLHVNASDVAYARGVEVYFLTLGRATDSEASRVAAWENAAGRDGVVAPATGADLGLILADLERAGSLERSSLLAEDLLETLGARGLVEMRSVKQAPFQVLSSARIPSVLIELGFLTNAKDVDLLGRPAFLSRLADALAEGIAAYRKSVAGG